MPTLHHFKTERTARYFTLGNETSPSQIWIACHGYGQLAERFLAKLAPLDDGRRLLIAPEALSRFYVQGAGGPDSRTGASWMTREDRLAEIDDYVRYLDGVYEAAAAGAHRAGAELHVLGFSQGAATAARWALQGTARVDRLVLWSGLMPPEIDLEASAARLNAMRLTLVAGDRDEWVNVGLPLMEAGLDEGGVKYRLVRFGGDHNIEAETLRRIGDQAVRGD